MINEKIWKFEDYWIQSISPIRRWGDEVTGREGDEAKTTSNIEQGSVPNNNHYNNDNHLSLIISHRQLIQSDQAMGRQSTWIRFNSCNSRSPQPATIWLFNHWPFNHAIHSSYTPAGPHRSTFALAQLPPRAKSLRRILLAGRCVDSFWLFLWVNIAYCLSKVTG